MAVTCSCCTCTWYWGRCPPPYLSKKTVAPLSSEAMALKCVLVRAGVRQRATSVSPAEFQEMRQIASCGHLSNGGHSGGPVGWGQGRLRA